MIKRLSASTLVVLAIAGCQQVKQEAPKEEKPAVAAAEVKEVQQKKEVDYTPRVINVNEVRFMPTELRSQSLGKDWENNKSLTDYIDPDNVGVKVDMSKDRKVDLKYTKQFALKVSAKNPKGYGSVNISSQWVKSGEKVMFEAIDDAKADFVKWEGDIKEGVEIKGQEISVVMDRPRTIYAVYSSKKNELSIDSKFGDPKGAGVYDRGQKASWSVTSPFNISDSERVVAPVASGSVEKLDDDKVIKIDWQKEYMLKTGADSMGSVKGGNVWVKKGGAASIEAVPADPSIGFVKWEGLEGAMATSNPLKLTMNKSYMLKAVFAKRKYNLTVNSQFGEITGNGLQPANGDSSWSVKSPVATDDPNVRMAAMPATGKVRMNGDKSVTVNWVKEFKVQISKKSATEETKVEDIWVKEGAMLKDYKISFPPQSTDKVYTWSGDIPRTSRGGEVLNFKVTKPVKVTANLVKIKSNLTFSNDVDKNDTKFEHLHTDMAEHKVPNIRYLNDGERLVLDKKALKGQVENLNVTEKKKVTIENSSNIQIVSFNGWKDCIRIKTAFAQVIISPQAGRVVYFGSPDNKTNLLWLNEDYVGKSTSKAEATEDWADKGGSRVWIAPLQARGVLTGKQFPPAYEVDGAPYQNTIINGNKVVVQNFPNGDYGCKIQRTFELKEGNKLVIQTTLVKTSDTKHHYLLGPLMLTQFVRPDAIRFTKSAQPKDHPKGYLTLQGEEPDLKLDPLDDSRFKLEIPESYPEEIKIGSYTPFTQFEFKGYILNAISKINKSAVFPEKNCNMTVFFPEAPTDYIEVGNFGELFEISDTKHVSEVIWALEKR